MNKFFIVFYLFVFTILSCPAKQIVLDSEIFTDFDGYEMQESDVVLIKNSSPFEIEIWNSETKKLAKSYSFTKNVSESIAYNGLAYLELISCDIIGDDIWAIVEGVQTNLIKLNISTGKLTFIAKNANDYYALKAIKKEDDGRGTIWLSQFMQPMSGGYVRCYDTDGNLLCKFLVKIDDTDFDVISLKYANGKYSAFCTCNGFFIGELNKNSDDQDCFRTLQFDLENKSYEFKNIPYTTFLSKEFLNQYDYVPQEFSCYKYCPNDCFLVLFLSMTSNVNLYKRVRFLYHYNSSTLSYEFIKAFDNEVESSMAIDYVNGSKENYTVIGRDLENDYCKLIGIYKNNILTTCYKVLDIKGYMLAKENQKYQWFSCKNDTISKAYIYDWENNRLYLTDENGNVSDVSDLVKVNLGNN